MCPGSTAQWRCVVWRPFVGGGVPHFLTWKPALGTKPLWILTTLIDPGQNYIFISITILWFYPNFDNHVRKILTGAEREPRMLAKVYASIGFEVFGDILVRDLKGDLLLCVIPVL